MLWMEGRRCKLWWCGKGDGVGHVEVMVKEELCGKVVEVRRVSDRVMTVVVSFDYDLLRLICEYAPQSGRRLEGKQSCHDDLKGEWDTHSAGDL